MTGTSSPAAMADIVAALIEVRSKCATIPKNGLNKFHGYKFATEADVSAHIQPLFDEAGLVLIPSVASIQDGFDGPRIDEHGVTQYVAKFTLAHRSGAVWPDPIFVVAQGDDRNSKGSYSDKGAYKASTSSYKYALLRLLMIATGDDVEHDTPESASTRKPPPLSEESIPPLPPVEQSQTAALQKQLSDALVLRTEELMAHSQQMPHAPKNEAAMESELKLALRKHLGLESVTGNDIPALLKALPRATVDGDGTVLIRYEDDV